ncbi:Mannosyl-oligosaccharide 1,2-alpha-mannosidase IC [Liparis tanakae]|uniref:Mannosyl-oligosaccharide 1,2-alpha-mannosidase IC n=1 Tax=Liparis tanakae TaxID=230148 RepID=A0A4Z2HRS3_9TELE|nr:Mannosyl-oligosaccharide 1,2-alpha-mannosidase IC [Liparis tanakae]
MQRYTLGGLRGASIIDSLDTLYIMGLMDEYKDAKEWVETSLDLNSLGTFQREPKASRVAAGHAVSPADGILCLFQRLFVGWKIEKIGWDRRLKEATGLLIG